MNDPLLSTKAANPKQTFTKHLRVSLDIDCDRFASITGGRWEVRPSESWRYRGLCWHEGAYVFGRIVLAKENEFRYGVNLNSLKPGMSDAGIIVSNGVKLSVDAPIFRVDSIHDFLRQLASFIRSETQTRIVAVTGSVGKTSSCYLLHHLLGFNGRVSTNGQFNYPDGIVSEAGNLGEVDYAVIEASLQGLGEATALLKPQVVVLTQISPVHLEGSSSLLALAEKKASLFNDLSSGGTAIINRDIAYFEQVLEIARSTTPTVYTFGEHLEADFRLVSYDASRLRIKANILGEEFEYKLGLLGRHMAINSLGAAAAAYAMGVDLNSLLPHCADARLVPGRGSLERLELAGIRISMIDDSYNASPIAMEAAFSNLASTEPMGNGRRIAVLSDMLELGDNSADYHRKLVRPLLESGVDKIYLVGDMMACLWQELPEAVRTPMPRKIGDLVVPLMNNLTEGDVILLKGSHGTGMHVLAEELRYFALAPRISGVGLQLFIQMRHLSRCIEPFTPILVKRWVSWQINKVLKRNHQDRSF